jgi:serine protease Do
MTERRGVGVGVYVFAAVVGVLGGIIGTAIAISFMQTAAGMKGGAGGSAPITTIGHVGVPDSFAAVVAKVSPAVVNVNTETTQQVAPLFDWWWGFGNQPRTQRLQGSGSGFIVESDGLVVTNQHVVQGADRIQVTLADGREFRARVQGQDALTDVAILKINAHNLPTIPLGDSDKMEPGDWVIAIGNPYTNMDRTVTVGVVSGTGRRAAAGGRVYQHLIQTDASINPGNSGGPLLNEQGQVIGINALIRAEPETVGLWGFAIPVNELKTLLPELKKSGRITRPWVGLSIGDVTPKVASENSLPVKRGALIAEVIAGGPAASADLRQGDIVTAIGSKKVESADDLVRIVRASKIGSDLKFTIERAVVSGNWSKMTVAVHVMQMPAVLPQTQNAQ